MTEAVLTCPNCRTEIKLTESLAAPLLDEARREFEHRLAQKDAAVAKRAAEMRAPAEALARDREGLDDHIAKTLRQERAKIASEEAKRAKLAFGTELDEKTKEAADLRSVLAQRDQKLGEAQKAQADLLRKQRELEDARRELDLTVETRIQEGLEATRVKARQEAEDQLKLKVAEKEETIASMKRQIEDLKRRAEQGSQQLQGEVLELELEALLKGRFQQDSIEPVPKGEHGGDVLHRVAGPAGLACGILLWESKRARNWSDGWLTKLRADQRSAKAELAILVSQVLPKGVDTFDCVEGVWIVQPRSVLPLALALRQSLIEVAVARQASEGQQTKMELVYRYLTGQQFRRRVEAIVDAFTSMKNDLDLERRAITKQWAKREEQIDHVMVATVGMYGDLQGIAGRTLQEIEGLEFKALVTGTAKNEVT